MILLTVDEIKVLHSKLIEKTGGSDGVRDINLLESAVFGASVTFGNEEIYPTVEEKAARLMYAITNNHPFIDGNKRIGVFTMLMTLNLNAVEIKYTQEELIDLGLSVAASNRNYEEVLEWINNHKL